VSARGAAVLAVALAACASPDPRPPIPGAAPGGPVTAVTPARSLAFVTHLDCGERAATVGSTGERWVLRVDGREVPLRATRADPGVRYDAPDEPGTSVTAVGDRARVTVRGEAWPDCRAGAPSAGAPPGPASFVARGHEPSWRLDLDGRTMRFATGPQGTTVEAATPAPEPAGAGRRWAAIADGRTLAVVATERVCTDTMTGMPHPLEVAVDRDGRRWTGCGGEPAALLGGVEWVVEDVDGGGIIDRSRITVTFLPDGRATGLASCNRWSGRWTLDAERLAIAGIAVGTRECAPSLAAQERRVLAALARTSRFGITPEGALRLLGPGPGGLLARR
jgi:heat shock protein HslJ